jgi:hypothetical protein
MIAKCARLGRPGTKEAGNLSRYIQLRRPLWSAPVGTTELPRVKHVFGLLKREVFVAYRSWDINIAGQSEHRITFLKREEKPAREFAQVAFALTPAAIHR